MAFVEWFFGGLKKADFPFLANARNKPNNLAGVENRGSLISAPAGPQRKQRNCGSGHLGSL